MIRPYLEQYRNQVAQFYDPNNDVKVGSEPSALNRTLKVAEEVGKYQHEHEKLQLSSLLHDKPVLFATGDLTQVVNKLISFVESSEVIHANYKEALASLQSIATKEKSFSSSINFTDDILNCIAKLAQDLPVDKLFPCLDLLRLLVTIPVYNRYYTTTNGKLHTIAIL
jgi:hypothetical protein